MIKELPDAVKSYIRSGVAITSLTQCVEELLLNSIDAGATNVAVRVDVGCYKVQVVDNGHGIPEDELTLVGNRYSTSKCQTVSDLEDLRYFGYRGEALASIKDACGILEIVTRTKHSSKPVCKLFQDGKPLPIKESAIPRPSIGTTITVHALFMNFPVRQKSINEGLELEKIRQRVAGLALFKPQVSVRLRNDANGTTIIHTNKCSSTLVTFASLFGQTRAQSLVEIKGVKGHFTVEGYFGKEGSTKKDIQFVYVNGRLVLKTQIHKVINQLLKKSAICKKKFDLSLVSPDLPIGEEGFQKSPGKQLDKHPMFIVNIKCPLTEYDITFDPAKTLVEFKDWDTLLQNITDTTDDFLKKEKLNLNQSNLNPEINDQTEPSESKLVSEISPSNIKDALISRPARRPGYKPNVNNKTPECLPLEQWKAENDDLIKSRYIPRSYTTCNSSTNSSNTTIELQASCDKSTENTTYKADIGTKCRKLSDGQNVCDIKANCDKHEQLRKDNELLNVPGKSVPSCSVKEGPRSGLSLFRKSVGKPAGIVHNKMAANIDNNLDRIAKLLPSSGTSKGVSFSSLQRFRKFASKYSKQDDEVLGEPDTEVLPPKFCRLNDVPRIEPHIEHIVAPCGDEDTIPDNSMAVDDKDERTEKGYETEHGETKGLHQVNQTDTNDNLANKENSIFKHTPLYQQCNMPVNLSTNFTKQSYSYDKFAKDEFMLRNHILNSSFQYEPKHMRPGLKLQTTTCLGPTCQGDNIPLSTDFSVTNFNEMKGNNLHLLCQNGQSETIKSDIFESVKDLSTKGMQRKRASSYCEEIAHKITKFEDGHDSALKHTNKKSFKDNLPCFRVIKEYSVNYKADNCGLENQENTQQSNQRAPDIVSCSDESRSAHSNSNRNTDSNNINTSIESSLFPVECASPNSIHGSQLFKNLPDLMMNDSQDSSNGEMLIAVPIDTNKVIQDIVKAGLNIPVYQECEHHSQEFIVGTESQDMVTKQLPHTDDTKSELMNTTQEFTPMSTEVHASNEEYKQTNYNKEASNRDKSPAEDSNQTSPCSTGFTPRLADNCSSHTCENTPSILSTSPYQKYSEDNTILPVVENRQGDNDESQLYDDTQLTQDTLDMPSILERSRLNTTLDDKMISPGSLGSERAIWNSFQGVCQSMTQSNKESNRNIDGANDFKDDVTVSQLLASHNSVSHLREGGQDTDDVVTFRDIFTPTQTDTQTDTHNIQDTANVAAETSTLEENIDYFSDTFDEALQNAHLQIDDSNIRNGKLQSQKEGDKSTEPELVVVKGKQCLKQNLVEQDSNKDNSNDTEGHWIEMKHPDTGKTVYVHSNLGIVVDQIDTSCNKTQTIKDEIPVKTTKNFETKINEEVNSEKSEVKAVALSSLQKMFDNHREKKEEETDIKWRDKQSKQGPESECSSVTELFSDWENPVFDNIRKSVLNVEMANSTNSRSTLKAMKTLHTCRFTKDMLKSVQVIGQLDKKFIVCLIQTDTSVSGPDLLALIDQHAAHERVRLELLTEEAYIDGNIERAELAKFSVDPAQSVKMDSDEIQVMMSFRDEFSRIGITFRVDTHVDDMIKVLTVPECLVVKDTSDVPKKELIYWDTIQTLIKGHVELLLSTDGARGRLPNIIHKLMCSQACHGAIKFGDKLSLTDCKSLIHDLSLCDLPFQCAHGRPSVMPILQLQQLDKQLPRMKQQKPQLHKLRLAMEKSNTKNEDENKPTVDGSKSGFSHILVW